MRAQRLGDGGVVHRSHAISRLAAERLAAPRRRSVASAVSPTLMPTWSSSTSRRWRPCSRAAATTSPARPGTRARTRVEEVGRARPRRPASQHRGQRLRRRRWIRSRSPRSPSGPWYTAYIEATTASSTWAVQMLEVALSRRMCCSRVCSARRYAGRPSASTETPTRRPGRCRSRPGGDGHVAGVRAAVEHRDAEPLRRADDDVGAELAGRLEQGERQQVGRDDGERAALVGRLDDRPRVEDPAGGAGVLHEHAAEVAVGQPVGEVGDDDLDAHRLGPGADHLDRLRQRVGVDHERARSRCAWRGVPGSSPRRPPCPRRAGWRWRSAARSGRR